MVVILRSAIAFACIWQERVGCPSISTVHAPHCPSPHPYFVPVRFSRSRRTSSSISSSAAETRWSAPLMFREISRIASLQEHCRALSGAHAPGGCLWLTATEKRPVGTGRFLSAEVTGELDLPSYLLGGVGLRPSCLPGEDRQRARVVVIVGVDDHLRAVQ